jgi:flavin reductase (DIM6/NTAB) family NADH-FMN oxidoreductase RutF
LATCREFVTHIISEWFLEAANHTCGPYDPDVDEMKLANLTPLKSHVVRSIAWGV